MKILKITIAFITALKLAACSLESSPQAPYQTDTSAISTESKYFDADLQRQIAEIAKEAKGKVGVYATVIETGQAVSLNPNDHFAMQSVVKLPISMAVMRLVTEEKLSLDQKIKVAKDEFVPANMRSPIRDNRTTEIAVRELIRYAISESDGTAADVLQRVAGGAKGVQAYIDSLGIADMRVKHTHNEFGREWQLQYENWATPEGVLALLKKLSSDAGINEVLEMHSAHPWKDNAGILLRFMTESNNPPNRIKAGLPPGTVVAHKTGTGGTQDGITSATNDVGIITLPNGNHVAIAVFVGDSTADLAAREAVIAKIARVVFDKWSQTPRTEPVKPSNFNERHTLN